MTIESFAVTWDYRCPFARIGHEHLIDALEAGAPWDVTFVPYFLNVSHVAEGGPSAWEDTSHQPDLLALLVGIVVRDRFSEHFLAVHRRLFNLRHDEGGDLRSREVLSAALAEVGVIPTPSGPRSTPGGRPRWPGPNTRTSSVVSMSSVSPPSSSAMTPCSFA